MRLGKTIALSLNTPLFLMTLAALAAASQWQVLKGQFYIQVQTESKVNGGHGFYILCTFVRGKPGGWCRGWWCGRRSGDPGVIAGPAWQWCRINSGLIAMGIRS